MSKKTKLPEEPISLKEFQKLHGKLQNADDKIRRSLEAADSYYHKRGESYPYIAFYHTEKLYAIFSAMKKYYGDCPSLLDVGCGTGVIVKLAQSMGILAQGIEFHEPYMKLGKEIHGLSDEDLVLGDAFEMTPEFLEKFNVLYTYMPLCNPQRMGDLHMSMYRKSRRGTILLEMYPMYYPMRCMEYNPKVPGWVQELQKTSHVAAVQVGYGNY